MTPHDYSPPVRSAAVLFLAAVGVASVLVFSGCGRSTKPPQGTAITAQLAAEREHPEYVKAQAEGKSLDPSYLERALGRYLQLIRERNGNAPESHYAAAMIYLNAKNNPLSAIYHLRECISLCPGTPLASQATALAATAEKRYLRQVPGRDADNPADVESLYGSVASLRRENDELKQKRNELARSVQKLERELAQAKIAASSRPPALPGERLPPVAESTAVPPPPEPAGHRRIPATYTVARGDKLSTISQKFYNTPVRWKDIYNLNRDKLRTTETKLQIGWVLKLPAS